VFFNYTGCFLISNNRSLQYKTIPPYVETTHFRAFFYPYMTY